MHLKKVEMQGFKSFADKIDIEFKDGITAIVGPNGSGKSNISDAIRWVLGEQSVKTLRGSKMEDIIFSGTDKRRALGYAEVTITFDNKNGVIPVEYMEVAITRRMFRSGESEYYINKNSCRLKDIKGLFMDTGVGTDGYSIIGQGRVDEILSTRPEDRRSIFEEAAGIVKYKSKKGEAEKKLEKTDNNLIRIKDLISELGKQSNSLKEQAEKANIYISLSNELKELEVNLFIREIDRIKEQLAKSEEEKLKLQNGISEITAEKNKIEDNFNLIKNNIGEIDLSIETIQEEKITILNLLNQSKNELKILEEKEKFHIKDIDRLEKEISDIEVRVKELEIEENSLLSENTNIREQLDLLKEEFKQKSIRLEKINEEIQANEKVIGKEKDKVIDSYNLITDKRSKINSIASFEENIDKRIKQIQRDIEDLIEGQKRSKNLLKDIEKTELDKKEEVVLYNKSLMNLGSEEKNHKNQLDNLYKEINQNKADLQGKISNFNLLKNMAEDYEGYYRGVKNLMLAYKKEERLKGRLIGVVADLLKVEEKYEKAVDVGLGASLQNVVTKDEEDTKFIIDYLRKANLGRVTFLPMTTIKSNPVHISPTDRQRYKVIGLGSELVSYDEKYKSIIEYLLGRTIVVEDLNDGVIVAKRFNYSFKVVTLQGDIINAGGSMTGGSLPKFSGKLLNRNYRIEKLKKEISSISKKQDKLEEEKTNTKFNLESKLEELKELEAKLQNTNIELIKIENERNKHNHDLIRVNETILKYKDEINKLNHELNGIDKDKDELKKELKVLETENIFIKDNIKDLIDKFEKEKLAREESSKEVTDTKIQINLIENKLINNNEKIEENKLELINIKKLKEDKKGECLNNKEEINGIIHMMSSTGENIKKLSREEEEKDKQFDFIKDEKDKLMEDHYLEQSRLKEINEKLNGLEKAKNNWDIKEAKYSVQLDNFSTRLLENYELEYDEAIELWIEIDNLDKAKQDVVKFKREIKKLGTINVGSIEEYKEISERLEFITKQHKDLLSAKENLQEVIIDMETKMKEQFLFNFNKINESFNQVFSVLFDGGKADLCLEDEEDILTCGIEIKAQPPGKKLQNLSLLSGGEKSLTAVALLFSILQIKPTPFCILDEIDAALDEANINRYTNYLKSFSDNTQFIMITHRKSTMEMSDVLYGVTMEEEGISKIVSVKLTDNLEGIAS